MITAYHRPETLEHALELIARVSPKTLPLGGGTLLSHGQAEAIEVVDLQALGLNYLKPRGRIIELGATLTLERLLQDPQCPEAFKPALKLEAPLNIRNAATVAGTVIACDGRSTLSAVLLAVDAKLTLLKPAAEQIGLGDFLPSRERLLQRALVASLEFSLDAKLVFESISRTPADKPIVAVALSQWPNGRTRLVVAGYGPLPLLAMDGKGTDGAETAARNVMHESGDAWASAEYRREMAATLTRRCLAILAE